MKFILLSSLIGTLALVSAHMAEIGKPALAFSGKTTKGVQVSLESLKGKVVVLEWINYECPFVKKH